MSAPHGPDRTVLMFAGQGSQYYFMGRELYENHRQFRDWIEYCSRLLQPHLGLSLSELLYSPANQRFAPFEKTRQTHPAVFALNYALGQTLVAEGVRPSAFLGYSLGELVSWTMAGVVRLEEVLPAVYEMAVRIEERTAPGGMLAILASPEWMQREPTLFDGLDLAGLNFPEHFVMSGPPDRISKLADALKVRHIASQILPISHGFHSFLLDPIEAEIKGIFERFRRREPEKQVISSSLARRVGADDLTAAHFWDILRGPVRFRATIEGMEQNGPWNYIDAGPSGTLATFVKNIIVPAGSASRTFAVLTPFGKDLRGLDRLKSSLQL